MEAARVFVSFSGRDDATRAFVTLLLQRLNDHQRDLAWMYGRLGRDIRAGDDIEMKCKEEIERASLFVAVVTPHAFESPYTRSEVRHALTLSRTTGLEIIPILREGTSPTLGAPPYDALSTLKCLAADGSGIDAVEPVVQEILARLRLPYQPPHEDLRHFPLLRRVFEEIGRVGATGYAIGPVLDTLRRVGLAAGCAYRELRLTEAARQLDALCVQLELFFPDQRFYYPRLARVILAIERGEEDIPRALLRIREIKDTCNTFDANLPAATGYLLQEMGRYDEALAAYEEAGRLQGPEPDPDISYNVIVSLINLGRQIPSQLVDTLTGSFAQGMVTRGPDEFTRFLFLRLLCEQYMGNIQACLYLLRLIPPDSVAPSDVALKILELFEQSDEPELLTVFEPYARRTSGAATQHQAFEIRHRLARNYFAQQRWNAGFDELAGMLADFPSHPVPRVEFALFQRLSGCRDGSKELLRHTVALKLLDVKPTMTESSFDYYIGFAWWLMGETARAEMKFEESGLAIENHYACIVRRFAGCAPPKSRD